MFSKFHIKILMIFLSKENSKRIQNTQRDKDKYWTISLTCGLQKKKSSQQSTMANNYRPQEAADLGLTMFTEWGTESMGGPLNPQTDRGAGVAISFSWNLTWCCKPRCLKTCLKILTHITEGFFGQDRGESLGRMLLLVRGPGPVLVLIEE